MPNEPERADSAQRMRAAGMLGMPVVRFKPYEPIVRVLALIEEGTWGDPRVIVSTTVPLMMRKLRMSETTLRRTLRWLMDGRFIERVPAITSAKYAYKAIRKDQT